MHDLRFSQQWLWCEEFYLLGYNSVYPVESQPTFRRHISSPSSGSKNTQSKLCLPSVSRWFLALFILRTWRWRRHIPPKHRLTFNGLYDVISQNIKLCNSKYVLENKGNKPLLVQTIILLLDRRRIDCSQNRHKWKEMKHKWSRTGRKLWLWKQELTLYTKGGKNDGNTEDTENPVFVSELRNVQCLVFNSVWTIFMIWFNGF
jgi:hypothetical protein